MELYRPLDGGAVSPLHLRLQDLDAGRQLAADEIADDRRREPEPAGVPVELQVVVEAAAHGILEDVVPGHEVRLPRVRTGQAEQGEAPRRLEVDDLDHVRPPLAPDDL